MGQDQSKDGEQGTFSVKNVMEVIQSFPSKNNELLRKYVDDSLKLGYLKISSLEQMEFVLKFLDDLKAQKVEEKVEEKKHPNCKCENEMKILDLLDKLTVAQTESSSVRDTRDIQLRELQLNQDIMMYKLDRLVAEEEKKQDPDSHANRLQTALDAANRQMEKMVKEVEEYKNKTTNLEAKLEEKQKEIDELETKTSIEHRDKIYQMKIEFKKDMHCRNKFLDEVMYKMDKLQEQLADKDRVIESLEKSKKDADPNILATLTQRCIQLQYDLDSEAKMRKNAFEEVDAYKAKIVNLEFVLESKKKQVAELEKTLEVAVHHAQDIQIKIQRELNTAQKQLHECKNRTTQLEKVLEEKMAKIEKLEVLINTMTGITDDEKAQSAETSNEAQTSKSPISGSSWSSLHSDDLEDSDAEK